MIFVNMTCCWTISLNLCFAFLLAMFNCYLHSTCMYNCLICLPMQQHSWCDVRIGMERYDQISIKNWTSSLNLLKIVVWYVLVEAHLKLLLKNLELDTLWISKAGVVTAIDGSWLGYHATMQFPLADMKEIQRSWMECMSIPLSTPKSWECQIKIGEKH